MSVVQQSSGQVDPSKVRKYFRKQSWAPIVILIVLGLILLLTRVFFIGILLLAAAGGLIYMRMNNQPTDADVDAAMQNALSDLKAQAMKKLNLDPDEVNLITPLETSGYDYRASTLIKKGKDGRYRGNAVEGLVVLFSDHEMHTYEKHVDLLAYGPLSESTGEYFYKDVVSITTGSDQVRSQQLQISVETLTITTSGGTSLSTTLFNTGAVADALNGARQLIKMKKRDG